MCERVWRQLLQKNLLRLKLYIIKRKFKFLEWICHLFHLVKRENVYFIRGFTTHEICIFRFTRWNKWHIHSKNLNILYLFTSTVQGYLISSYYLLLLHIFFWNANYDWACYILQQRSTMLSWPQTRWSNRFQESWDLAWIKLESFPHPSPIQILWLQRWKKQGQLSSSSWKRWVVNDNLLY